MTTWVNLASLYIVILCISIFHPCHGCEYSWISASPLPPSSSSSTSSPSSPWLWQPGWIWPPCNAREYPANERLCSQALWPWVACKNYFQKKDLQKKNKTLFESLIEYNNNLCTCQAWHPVDSHLEIPLKSWVENYTILRSELLWKWNHLGKNVGEFVMRMGRRSELAGRNRYSWTDHMFTMSSAVS